MAKDTQDCRHICWLNNAFVAQGIERRTSNPQVAGSIPAEGAIDYGCLIKYNIDITKEIKMAQGPCWDGYEQVGWKTQNGKRVPNCVPKNRTKKAADRFEIVENHPKCEGVALVELDGTTVLCYLNREEAQAALEDMRLEEPPASVRPNEDTLKSKDNDDESGESHDKKKKKKKSDFWRGSFA